jgi:hypothetical protein
MSLPSAAAPTQPEGPRLPGEPSLPPVEAPTGTFILQLFLIPLLIVSIVVALWLLFSWVAHMGRDDPKMLAKSITRGDAASWQRAFELADLLRSPDPKYDALRRDSETAKRLAEFLERDLKEVVSGQTEETRQRVMRRMFLCRALGSFHVTTGLPVLLRAASEERDPVEVEVRYSALEAIATLADNCGPQALQDDEQVLAALLAAAEATDATSAPPPAPNKDGSPVLYRPHSELRAVAAYALGVLGGDRAQAKLTGMLDDPYPNARYNAATGLARAGDAACERILKEMLDPDNDVAVRDEKYKDNQARKRTTVLLNGIKGTLLLAETNPRADLSRLKASLTAIVNSPLENVPIEPNKIKRAAAEALQRLEKEPR